MLMTSERSAHLGGELADDVAHIRRKSACWAGVLPSKVWNGTERLIDSTTRAPAMPKDLRVSSCAHTPPYWPMARDNGQRLAFERAVAERAR